MQLSWHPKLAGILIVLVTLGLCAFFLAQGITNLVALKLLPYKAQESAAGASTSLTELKGEAPPDAMAILRRNIFDPMPGEGSWDTVLLADGNIGIGGSPVNLLRRAAELLDLTGRVVCDLAAPGTGVLRHHARLVTELKRSGSFPTCGNAHPCMLIPQWLTITTCRNRSCASLSCWHEAARTRLSRSIWISQKRQ